MQVDIGALAELARIAIPEDEKMALEKEIPAILSFVEKVQSVESMIRREERVSQHYNVFREDEAPHAPGTFTEKILANMKSRKGNYMQVQQVLKKKDK